MGRLSFSILAFAIAALLALMPAACGGLSGDVEFVAKGARLGKWEDKRSSGSIINHDMLILDEPRAFGSEGAPLGLYVVTTRGSMAAKIDDIVNDRLPSMRGQRMNFAVGSPIAVKIEKVVAGGKRELVLERRASFLEVTR